MQTIRIIALVLIEFEARHLYIRCYGNNMTMQCIFWEEDGALSSTVDSWWMTILIILNSISFILLGAGTYEFICTQTPYSMRGFISCYTGEVL